MQLGFYQIDPRNPWPAGDVERASRWLSNHPTQLVDATSGSALSQFGYEERTAELTYNGNWSGDVMVKFKQKGGSVESMPFRIRVLTPTVVYGDNAVSINTQKKWEAKTCPSETTTFVACRSRFVGGASDTAPLIIYITPGNYTGQDWYLTERKYIYVLGDPGNRPTLNRDEISGPRKAMFYVANLTLRDTNIAHTGALRGSPNVLIVRNVYQCCETQQANGVMNPAQGTLTDQWAVYWHQSETKGMGGTGNTTHAAYVEGRPFSLFDVNNLRVLGTRASSGIKTTMAELNIRHSSFHVAESMADLKEGTCSPTSYSTGCLMHTVIDVPGYTQTTIYANKFEVWKGPTKGVPTPRWGIVPAVIFFRQRGNSYGSDIPAYPNVSWTPPVSTQSTLASPCRGWPGHPSTYVADKFWSDVRGVPLGDHANPCTFKHYVSYNKFIQLPGSLPIYSLRDDGTYPARAEVMFSIRTTIHRNHPFWAERSTSFLFGNTYENYGTNQRLYRLNFEPSIKEIKPGAFWPRQGPEEYPRVMDQLGEELPPWFKL